MTDRERWIIYPLLFFALALAARGQSSNLPTVGKFDTVVCRDLRLLSHNGHSGGAKMVAIAGAVNGQGLMLRFDGNQQMLLTPQKVVRPSRVVVKSVDSESATEPKEGDSKEADPNGGDSTETQEDDPKAADPADPKAADEDGQDAADSETDKGSTDESKKEPHSEPAPSKGSPATDDASP